MGCIGISACLLSHTSAKATFETAWWIPGLGWLVFWWSSSESFSHVFSPSMNGLFTLQLKQTNCQFFCWQILSNDHFSSQEPLNGNIFFAGVHTLQQSNATFAGQKIQPTCVDALVFGRPCFCQRVSCRQPRLKELNPNGVYHLRLCQAGQFGLLRT